MSPVGKNNRMKVKRKFNKRVSMGIKIKKATMEKRSIIVNMKAMKKIRRAIKKSNRMKRIIKNLPRGIMLVRMCNL